MSGGGRAGAQAPEHPDPAVEQLVRDSFARQGLMRHLGASIVGIRFGETLICLDEPGTSITA